MLMQLLIGILCWQLSMATNAAVQPQAEKLQQSGASACGSKMSCHECIQTATCAWCFQRNITADRKRCFEPGTVDSLSSPIDCLPQFVWNPRNEKRITMQRELTRSVTTASSDYWTMNNDRKGWSSAAESQQRREQSEIVQISPQRLKLQLRVKQSYRLQMFYAQAEDYPVDLYYLMDLSKSMEDDKHKLSALGNLLVETMRNMTSNFRIGFGSFVDKVVMPYVNTMPKFLKEPCKHCAAPYGFRNVMKLSNNTRDFSDMVKRASISGNLDAPEGSLDAIMQAIVCRDDIGWREQARRLLVLSTDAGFHYAGDGKLGGIVLPNDGFCHLDSSGLYTHSSNLDYPSISQINLKVKENAINVIFAVTEQKIKTYKQLQNHIEGSSCGQLSDDSANVVDLVKEQYEQISSTIEMRDNASSALRLTYHSHCLDSGRRRNRPTATATDQKTPRPPLRQTSRCENVRVGDLITFAIDIELVACPKDRKLWHELFQIYPVGLNESLLVDLEMLCDCPCERDGNDGFVPHAPECNRHGTLKCGVCECDRFYFGKNCECSTNYASSRDGNTTNVSGCRADNRTQIDCSGRGNCVCGQCECETRPNENEVISGSYCECDNFSCDRRNGALCSGAGHGQCVCGQCQCNPLYGGSACDCLVSNRTCIAPDSNEICSGHGQCVCGQCKCDQTDDGKYTGLFCDKCPTCPGRCKEFKECVQCLMYGTGPLKDPIDCATNCTIDKPIGVAQIEVDEEKRESLCAYHDEDDCRFAYVYTYDKDNRLVIRAQTDRECPPKVFMLGFVLFVVAGVVIVGMAVLLLWKVLTTIHDRREFARFEKERMLSKWETGQNPIYKQATSTFRNPTYSGKL